MIEVVGAGDAPHPHRGDRWVSPPSEPEVRTPVEERITGTPDRLHSIRQRLEWLDGRVPAPHLVRSETGVDAVLVVERLAGEPATAVQHRVDATRSIASFANTLAAVHALDAATCPFQIDVASMVEGVVRRAAAGELTVDDATYAHVTPARLADLLAAGAGQFAAPAGPWCAMGIRPWGAASSTAEPPASDGSTASASPT